MKFDDDYPKTTLAGGQGRFILFIRRRVFCSLLFLFWLLLPLLVIACSGGSTLAVTTATSAATPCVTPGCKAPNFTLETLSGEKVELATLRGQPVVINFWTTWCTYCQDELPDFQKFYAQSQDQPIVILAINQQEPYERVQSFVDQHKLTFPVLVDRSGSVGVIYRVDTLPTTVIVDSQGIIYHVQTGYLTRAELESYVEQSRVAAPTVVPPDEAAQATETAAAPPTETPVPTPTPVIVMEGCVASTALNVRTGPGNEATVVDGLFQGDCRSFDGRTGDGNWLRLSEDYLYEDQRMWVAARHISLSGDLNSLHVVE